MDEQERVSYFTVLNFQSAFHPVGSIIGCIRIRFGICLWSPPLSVSSMRVSPYLCIASPTSHSSIRMLRRRLRISHSSNAQHTTNTNSLSVRLLSITHVSPVCPALLSCSVFCACHLRHFFFVEFVHFIHSFGSFVIHFSHCSYLFCVSIKSPSFCRALHCTALSHSVSRFGRISQTVNKSFVVCRATKQPQRNCEYIQASSPCKIASVNRVRINIHPLNRSSMNY